MDKRVVSANPEELSGVVSMTETTGLFAAMPPNQAGADALTEQIIPTHRQKAPKVGNENNKKCNNGK